MSLLNRFLLVVACVACPSLALAQPDPNVMPAPPPGAPVVGPPVVVAVPCPMGMSDKACSRPLLDADPRYQAAKSRRNTGIVLTSVGSGVGLITLIAAWSSYMSRDMGCIFGDCHHDYTGEKVAAAIGGGLVIASLAVGIPLIVSGSREMRFIRNQYLVPMPSISVGPRVTSVGMTWRF